MAENSPVKVFSRWAGRLLLGGVFVYAAVQKIMDPPAFAVAIDHYRLLPHPLTLVFALYLPWLELICGLSVISRWHERGALLLVMVLCGIFCLALTAAWFRGLDINCGCFGHSSTSSSLPWAIARSFCLALLALILFKRTKTSPAAGSALT